jgi:hypothetical protein
MSNWYEDKESAVFVSDDDEPYMDYHDVPNGSVMNEMPYTWYPLQEEDQDLAMHEEFGNPREVKEELEQEKESTHKRGFNMRKKQIESFTERLDKVANQIEENWEEYGMTKREAYDICLGIDRVADAIEDSEHEDMEEIDEEEAEAITMERDGDEPYLDYYDEGGVLDNQQDADEDYMDHYDRADAEDQFDYPLEGETGEELQGHPKKDSSSRNWYEDSKTSSSGNWYGDSKTSSSGNWYEGGGSSKTASRRSDWSGNWYE